jgi:hypothetical protein
MGYLQLAENSEYLQDHNEYLQDNSEYLQDNSEYLQDDYSQLADNSASQIMANYIFIPGGLLPNTPTDKYVRLDFFDGLPEAEFIAIMEKLLPYQKNTLSDSVVSNLLGMVPGVGGTLKGGANIVTGLFKGRKERKKAKAEKNAIKTKSTTQELINTELPTKTVAIPPFDISTTIAGQDYQISTQQDQKAENFFTRYKTPLLIGGGILALGTIYLITRKK